MIKVKRCEAPANLNRYKDRWTNNLLAEIASQGGDVSKVKDSFWDKYNKPYVRATLIDMFHGKCAYCESKIVHVEYPHIEHYRPKKKYPPKTFAWCNLLLACAICNGASYKGTNFPLDGDGDPLLIDPCVDDPRQHLRFENFFLVAITEKGTETRETLGLNRDELQDYRRGKCNFFSYLIRCLVDQFRDGETELYQEGRTIIQGMLSKNSEYAGMYRQVFLDALENITDAALLSDIHELILLAQDHAGD